MLDAELRDQLQLGPRVDLAAGVVGRVDHDRARSGVERRAQLDFVERPVRRAQLDIARHGAAEHTVGPVVLVEGLEDDDLIAGIDRGEHRRDHRLGRTAGHGDLGLSVDRTAPRGRVLARDGLAQDRRPPGGRVLVVTIAKRPRRRLQDPRVGLEIGKPLGEVDRFIRAMEGEVEARHLADDRLGEALRLQRLTDAGGCTHGDISVRDLHAPGEGRCSSMSSTSPGARGCVPTSRRPCTSSGSWRRSRARQTGSAVRPSSRRG